MVFLPIHYILFAIAARFLSEYSVHLRGAIGNFCAKSVRLGLLGEQ